MNNTIKITSVIAGILIGVTVTAQFKTQTTNPSSYPLDELQTQNELIQSYNNDQNVLKSKITFLQKKVDELLNTNDQLKQTTSIDELNNLRSSIGLQEVSGKGFLITLADNPNINRASAPIDDGDLVYAADLRDVINIVRANNADGISINDQRIIATTTINSVGNTILVNNSNLTPPFSIKVIGDYESFVRRLEQPGILSDLLKRAQNNQIIFKVEQAPYVQLPIYNGQYRLKYISSNES